MDLLPADTTLDALVDELKEGGMLAPDVETGQVDELFALGGLVDSADGGGNPVGADLLGIAVADVETGFGPRLEHERVDAEVLAAAAAQRVDHLGDHRRQRDLPDPRRIAPLDRAARWRDRGRGPPQTRTSWSRSGR